MNTFIEHTKEQHTDTTASCLLDGLFMIAKNQPDSDFRKLLDAFSRTFLKVEQQNNATYRELIPQTTDVLVSLWERDLGIPDDVFNNSGTIEERVNNIILKLASLGAQTEEDFIAIASLIGFDNIEITPGGEVAFFPLPFPCAFFSNAKTARFTVFVDVPRSQGIGFFPIPFPCNFIRTQNNPLEALFQKLRPANVQLIFRYIL